MESRQLDCGFVFDCEAAQVVSPYAAQRGAEKYQGGEWLAVSIAAACVFLLFGWSVPGLLRLLARRRRGGR